MNLRFLTQKELIKLADEFRILPVNEIKQKYHIDREGSEWKVAYAKNDLLEHPNIEPTSLIYRPFDNKFTIFTEKSKGFLARPRFEVLRHLKKPNIALLVKRQCKREFSYAFVVDDICEACVFESAYAKIRSFLSISTPIPPQSKRAHAPQI